MPLLDSVCRVLCRFCMYPPSPLILRKFFETGGLGPDLPCLTSRCKKARRVPDFGLLPDSILAGLSSDSHYWVANHPPRNVSITT
jgi:hypothetical protein